MKLILSTIFCMLFLSCQNNKRNDNTMLSFQDKTSKDTASRIELPKQQDNKGITMITLENEYSLPLSKLNVRIINNSDVDVITGVSYYIEYYKENEWMRVPLNYAFIEIAIVVFPNEQQDYVIDLQTEKYNYTKGLYRIVKDIKVNNKDLLLKAEFKVS